MDYIMNKYQDALDRFKVVAQNDWVNNYQKCKDEEKTTHIGNYRMFEIDGEAIETLQELVDKEKPMKVKHVVENGWHKYVCGSCDGELELKHCYCPECGQELDWSDE